MQQKMCTKCKETKDISEFYKRKDRKDSYHAYCKLCSSQDAVDRQRKFKEKCVEYKGGSCKICGYSKCISALEFHHRDPKEKDFSVSKIRLKSWDKNQEKIKSELDKCDLLCANCHREVHESSPARIRT